MLKFIIALIFRYVNFAARCTFAKRVKSHDLALELARVDYHKCIAVYAIELQVIRYSQLHCLICRSTYKESLGLCVGLDFRISVLIV